MTGTVLDAETSEPLIGASVRVDGTTIGDATDIDGQFSIENVPVGAQTLIVSYVGYESEEVPVEIVSGLTVEVDVALGAQTLDEVVVYETQIQGQEAAIEEQFESNVIGNVVSQANIQELPDNNSAESIGRIPGVGIQRSGGEATNVTIRGLSPRFNNVTVNGVRLASTSGDDRAVDLSLISSNILGGIDVRKAITPDLDGDAVGGTINLRLLNAPVGLRADVLAQGGYTGLQEYLGNYKFVGSASNRFLDDRLGVIATFNTDQYDRSADKLDLNYGFGTRPDGVEDLRIDAINLREDNVLRTRIGGSLLLDYALPADGRITANAFYNQIENDNLFRIQNTSTGAQSYQILDQENETGLLTSALGVEQDFGWVRYDAQASFTGSRSRSPNNYQFNFASDGSAFEGIDTNQLYEISPDSLYRAVAPDSLAGLTDIYLNDFTLDEDQTALQLNLQTPFRLGELFSGYVKTGGKLRWLDRVYDNEQTGRQGFRYIGETGPELRCLREAFADNPEWLARIEAGIAQPGTVVFPISIFASDYARQEDFLEGQYGLGIVPDEQLLRELLAALQSDACTAPDGDPSRSQYLRNAIGSIGSDYDGTERYQAGYLMAELNIGDHVTLIPGFRYEHEYSRYNGQRFRALAPAFRDAFPADLDTLTIERDNGYLLPMVHLDIRPVDWVSLRLARTETISRPGFRQYAPITSIDQFNSTINANNALLRSAQATNYDASLQVRRQRLGLVGVSAFYKEIDDLILQVQYPVNRDIPPPEGTSVPVSWYTGATPNLYTYINNPEPTTFYGVEFEWQTNFAYLPGPLSGLLLNVNYTRSFSETTYQSYRSVSEFEFDPETGDFAETFTLVDTTRTGRMPDQTAHIANITVGYDYAGFSTRLSYLFQSNTTAYVNPQNLLYDEFVGDYSRLDVSVRQKVTDGFELFGNFNNLTNRPDRIYTGQNSIAPAYVFSETDPSYRELYGYTIDVGARYRF